MQPWVEVGELKSPKPESRRNSFLSLILSPKLPLLPSSFASSRCDGQRHLATAFLLFLLLVGLVWHCRSPLDANVAFVIFPATATESLSPSSPIQEHGLKLQPLNREPDLQMSQKISQSHRPDENLPFNVTRNHNSASRTGTMHSVCWHSGAHNHHDNQNRRSQSAGEFPGITISGSGCSTCTVGESCSFTIKIRPPARWSLNESLYTSGLPFKKELIVLMRGPALVTTYVAPDPADRRSFLVTYRPWDEGSYGYEIEVQKWSVPASPRTA